MSGEWLCWGLPCAKPLGELCLGKTSANPWRITIYLHKLSDGHQPAQYVQHGCLALAFGQSRSFGACAIGTSAPPIPAGIGQDARVWRGRARGEERAGKADSSKPPRSPRIPAARHRCSALLLRSTNTRCHTQYPESQDTIHVVRRPGSTNRSCLLRCPPARHGPLGRPVGVPRGDGGGKRGGRGEGKGEGGIQARPAPLVPCTA